MRARDEDAGPDLPASRPSGLAIASTPDGTRLSWSPRTSETYVVAILSALLEATLIRGLLGRTGTDRLVLALLAVLVAVLVYWCVSELVNRISIVVSPRRLSIRQGPLPWHAPIELAARDLGRLPVVRQGRKRRDLWALAAVLTDGEERVLVPNLPSDAWARFLAHTLERAVRPAAPPPAAG